MPYLRGFGPTRFLSDATPRSGEQAALGAKIIAAILEAPVIEKILTHLGLQARAKLQAPARGQAMQAA